MAEGLTFDFSARISVAYTEGLIRRSDGETAVVQAFEVPTLLLDLGAGGSHLPNRERHYQRVLGEWFARKTAFPRLRMVS